MQEAGRKINNRAPARTTNSMFGAALKPGRRGSPPAPRWEISLGEKKNAGEETFWSPPPRGKLSLPYLFLAVFLAAFFAGFFADFLALFFTVFFTATITPPSHLVELKSCKMISHRRVLVNTFMHRLRKFLHGVVRREWALLEALKVSGVSTNTCSTEELPLRLHRAGDEEAHDVVPHIDDPGPHADGARDRALRIRRVRRCRHAKLSRCDARHEGRVVCQDAQLAACGGDDQELAFTRCRHAVRRGHGPREARAHAFFTFSAFSRASSTVPTYRKACSGSASHF